MTSSMGRLFDAVASLTGIFQKISFEGQAAMALEFRADPTLALPTYCYKMDTSYGKESAVIDWSKMVEEIIEDFKSGKNATVISTRFHATLVEMIIDVAKMSGQSKVVLTGGCFQNRVLSEMAIKRLKQEGFEPFWHKQVPANDGGIALGQIYAGARRKDNVSSHTRKD